MWIVNNKQISTTACKSAAHTNSVILSASTCAPLSRSFLVICNHSAWKNRLVIFTFNQIPHSSTKIFRQTRRVRRHNDLFVGVLPQKPRREQVGAELRLTHTGCNVDNHTFFLTGGHIGKYFRQFPVVCALFEPRIHRVSEGCHRSLRLFELNSALLLFQFFQKLKLLLCRHPGQQRCNLLISQSLHHLLSLQRLQRLNYVLRAPQPRLPPFFAAAPVFLLFGCPARRQPSLLS